MENPFNWKTIERDGKKMHEGVHALIVRDNKFLLVERRFYPFGFSPVAGHADNGETPEQALEREVREEIGVRVVSSKLLFTLEQGKACPIFWRNHFNHIYLAEIEGEPNINFESKSFGWYAREEITNLPLTSFAKTLFNHPTILGL